MKDDYSFEYSLLLMLMMFAIIIIIIIVSFWYETLRSFRSYRFAKNVFITAIGNVQPMQSVFQTLSHGNRKNETEEGKKRCVSIERSTLVRKK